MWTIIDSPVGELRLVAHDGAITAIDFMPALYAENRPRGERSDSDPLLVECARQLAEYFAGDRTSFDLPLAPAGTPFQVRVWEQLRLIEYGSISATRVPMPEDFTYFWQNTTISGK